LCGVDTVTPYQALSLIGKFIGVPIHRQKELNSPTTGIRVDMHGPS
jgi:hypothetical protein